MYRRGVVLLIGALACVLAGAGVGRATAGLSAKTSPPQGELMQADRDFARAAAERGIEGWMSYFAEDAARMPAPGQSFIRGHAAIRAADEPLLENRDLRLDWEPTAAHMFGDRAYGITTGDYSVVRRADDQVVGCGSYVTFWRRTATGWEVVFDTGTENADGRC